MLFKKQDDYSTPVFGTIESGSNIPKDVIGKDSIAPNIAYRLIKDELMNEGNARLNLATFCQTYMEEEATKLMSETLEKNA
ncbi:MAG: glutamate decarboxylase, partial [Paeniclostridium sordellii]|nr:glutamate decarboxylase [Paeniclostridium sordellii]